MRSFFKKIAAELENNLLQRGLFLLRNEVELGYGEYLEKVWKERGFVTKATGSAHASCSPVAPLHTFKCRTTTAYWP